MNLKKIKDGVVYSNVLTVGNENDFANLLNRVYPAASASTVKSIRDILDAEFASGQKVSYMFTQEQDNSISDIAIPLPTGWLYFKSAS